MAEKIHDFAERILFGEALAEKLSAPAIDFALEDSERAPIAVPAAPGRESQLRFRAAKNSETAVFRGGDESERGRGMILHHFANHELLALELMALMLLRFPEAPLAMRRDLVRMITEEQRHLGLYLERMGTLDVALGELPLNDFFWRLMAELELPAFVAAMNLTFEQANLDHALYYRDYFANIGDRDSAAILEIVLAEEIGHVKGGLAWFRKYKEANESDWSAYRRLLPANMSPVRARGPVFNRAARLAAGLTAEYIDTLEVFADSKGHPVRVFLFDPICDEAVGSGRRGYQATAAAVRLGRDLETIPALLASAEDVVLVAEEPSHEFRLTLKRAGFEVPRFVAREKLKAIQADKLGGLYPWGWSPDTRARLQSLFPNIVKEPGALVRSMQNESNEFPAALRTVYSKTFDLNVLDEVLADEKILATFGHLLEAQTRGQAITTIEEIDRTLNEPVNAGHPFVLKSPFSAAGRRRIFVHNGTLTEDQTNWARKQLAEFGSLVLEPWLDRVLDISWQGEILPDGAYVSHGSVRFLTDAKGGYRASWIGSPYHELPRDLRRFLDGQGVKENAVLRLLERAAEIAAGALQAAGYQGAFSIDALVYRRRTDDLQYRVKPIVEINPRYTMGRVARELMRHVRYGSFGLFALLSRKQIKRAGFPDFSALDQQWQQKYPLALRRSGRADLITTGYLPLNDPAAVEEFLPLLWCGKPETMPAVLANLNETPLHPTVPGARTSD